LFNKLKKKELSELVFEGALTLGIVYLLYIGMELMFNRLVATPPGFLRPSSPVGVWPEDTSRCS